MNNIVKERQNEWLTKIEAELDRWQENTPHTRP